MIMIFIDDIFLMDARETDNVSKTNTKSVLFASFQNFKTNLHSRSTLSKATVENLIGDKKLLSGLYVLGKSTFLFLTTRLD